MNSAEADLAEAGRTIAAQATEVAERLAGLRRELEPTRELWSLAGADLGPADEWTLAVDGLLGPDGVLAQISCATSTTWPAFPGVGWAGDDAAAPRG